MVFGGSGVVAGIYRNLIGPILSFGRRFYRKYLSGIVLYAMLITALLVGYELFVNRKVLQPCEDFCCRRQPSRRQRSSDAVRDLARQERIRLI